MRTFHVPKAAVTALVAIASFVATTASYALGPSDPQDKTYQCAVAGQTWGCGDGKPSQAVRIEERLQPGPRAAYAIHTGVPKAEAIAKARAGGEVPIRQVVRITTRQLSPAEQWDRVNGRYVSPWEKVEVLSSAPDTGPGPVAQGDKPATVKR
ncbi:hypothetical protein LRH25_19605 [Ideonella azotifigens]|uniref:DUF4124 domain-containing protein n=1 Tax=Ideonella azotifigens TaxID=513160 RepID=A0ABN1K6C4_9BURK|nr:hypothetical protein [Ideonella azotifigens]MCD2342537.1 hypothetical protein [Ideonella azotifigens]